MSDQCVFCGIVAGTAPAVKVTEDETTCAFMDIHPASDGHLLVVPKRHSRDLLDIPDDDLSATARTAKRVATAVVDELGADGVNLLNCCGADAWQTVFHFHLHVIPRYVDKSKDGLSLPWKPGVPGDRQLLDDLGGRLAAALS
ncbi:HIT family protein [Prauserella rugosa]|uniref:Histidine triad (HIT) family protein n=1 Tax=Prauserella rugosa TaxID=43354 RepID=A0A660CM15_9PSEU|nr:HIT domain-containing protein [Prauserella rugosa]KID30921.1 HIT family hydrolase, diadenosine tetraphosphate hydrolase [Prauserella sp. Am3]KMS92235.1 HIT family hydrolase [Streptomyces regensis]TWH22699.1 histidine triad (HIT) family protein [Prauserella rugosa]